jgi:membrane-associated phospholipid phosphatase
MSRKLRSPSLLCFCLAAFASLYAAPCVGQVAPSDSSVSGDTPSLLTRANDSQAASAHENQVGLDLLKNLVSDQATIWSSPARLKLADADWLLPLGVTTGILFATDAEVSRHLSNSPSVIHRSQSFSQYGLGSFAAASAGLYMWGHVAHEEHKRETGLLAIEAAMNSLAVDYALKYSLGRERPLVDNYRGRFFQGGGSFPSEHSAAVWSMASVIAHEYPGTLPTVLSYGLATAVTMSRVGSKEHFPSDVLIGSAIGWFVGEEVYRHHHNPELAGRTWETYSEIREDEPGQQSHAVASPYVELDSWIYPAIERLAALGHIPSDYLGIRPWTRLECAQMVDEAGDSLRTAEGTSDEASKLYEALQKEFSADLSGSAVGGPATWELESLYSRFTGIDGLPLADSDHFGQTIYGDSGRPYREGFNSYQGVSTYGTIGRFAIYVRGEYQHAPSAAAYALPVRQAIAVADDNPLQPAVPINTTDQFTLLDTYLTTKFYNWNFSFGKQSLWWGPEDLGALILSDNAAPMYMFRATPEQPFEVPLLSHLLGPFKTDFFVGKLSENQFPARPVIHGEKVSFKPTHGLEIGFSRLVEFGGVGRPLTAGAVWNSFVSVKSSVNYRESRNPGKRTSGFDISYRLPFVDNGLTIYADSLAADDVVPLANPPRAAWNTGVYLPRVPLLSKLDLRVEGGYTDATTPRSSGGEYVYWDLYYHDLSLNDKNLIGTWLGREGKGIRAVSTYWLSPRNNIQFGYREAKVAKDFVPSGETINDGSIAANWWLRDVVSLSASVQYEKWVAPLLAPGPQTNWTSSVQVTFWPRNWRSEHRQTAQASTDTEADSTPDGK